jgi:hypothetical protein
MAIVVVVATIPYLFQLAAALLLTWEITLKPGEERSIRYG